MSPAWACVSGPAIHFSSTSAKPGDTIAVTGSGFNAKGSIAVHWNALNGPVLATMHAPDAAGAMGSFTVPADAQTGTYVVVFLQQGADGTIQQAPIRGVVSVSSSGAANAPTAITPSAAARADGLVTNHSSVAVAGLALTAVGVAGGVILLAGLGVFVAGRRRSEPETVASR
jgi:hypothetical protein